MRSYEVMLGIDRAARDTSRRITLQVREQNRLSAAISAEERADALLDDPLEYTHAISVRALGGPPPAEAVALPVAA